MACKGESGPAENWLEFKRTTRITSLTSLAVMKRVMLRMTTPNGRVVKCTACSWWAPETEELGSADKAFEDHVCEDHPPLKKPGRLQSEIE